MFNALGYQNKAMHGHTLAMYPFNLSGEYHLLCSCITHLW